MSFTTFRLEIFPSIRQGGMSQNPIPQIKAWLEENGDCAYVHWIRKERDDGSVASFPVITFFPGFKDLVIPFKLVFSEVISKSCVTEGNLSEEMWDELW